LEANCILASHIESRCVPHVFFLVRNTLILDRRAMIHRNGRYDGMGRVGVEAVSGAFIMVFLRLFAADLDVVH